jgi:hypothetical protein
VNWGNDRVGLGRQEAEQLMLSYDRGALASPRAAPSRPQAGEGEQRPIICQGEPDRRLARPGVLTFAEGRRGHDTTIGEPEPSAPVRARDFADVCERLAAELRRSRHAPTRHDQLALTIRAAAHDRSHLVGDDAREQRRIAGAVMAGAKPLADRSLPFGEAVKVAYGRRDSGRAEPSPLSPGSHLRRVRLLCAYWPSGGNDPRREALIPPPEAFSA